MYKVNTQNKYLINVLLINAEKPTLVWFELKY